MQTNPIQYFKLKPYSDVNVNAQDVVDDAPEEDLFVEADGEVAEEAFNHVQVQFNAIKRKLPQFRKWRHTLDSVKISTRKKEWANFSFQTINHIVHGINMSDDNLKKADVSVPSTLCYIVCPHTFFPKIMEGVAITCPSCKSGDQVIMDGWSKGFRVCHDIGGYKLIKARRYKCKECTARSDVKGTYFSSLNEHVVASYHPLIRASLPFIVYGRGAYMRPLVRMITAMKDQGLSFNGIHAALKSVQGTMDLELAKGMMEMAKTLSHISETRQDNGFLQNSFVLDLQSFKPASRCVGRERVRDLYCSSAERMLPFMDSYMLQLGGHILKIDHTFAVCKFIRSKTSDTKQAYAAFFTVMNGCQEVIAYYFVQSKWLHG